MSLPALMMNGATAVIGLVMLCLMAFGSWRFGFLPLFRRPLGRVIMVLGVIDLVGLMCWS